ncbi:hypothetical protein N657DRAFT_644605 [Parathielavia appendiculata]|uniref:Uncharacterized protein n=1 Tax=Parathielavia appendiculata TaxID=2587402 RepID=A0AAN6U107_9PEZI|nr:hypothetical protein N657DRAFT_644605 [Parathielavia appendiculata]
MAGWHECHTHGHAGSVDPRATIQVDVAAVGLSIRPGPGITADIHRSVHYAIPLTNPPHDRGAVKVATIWVYFEAGQKFRIRRLSLWDGQHKIHEMADLN